MRLALFWSAYIGIILAVTRGNTQEIVAAAEVCLRLPFGDPKGPFHICVVLARVDDAARALMALRRTVDVGFSCPAALNGEPSLRVLHGRSEFEATQTEVERGIDEPCRHARPVAETRC